MLKHGHEPVKIDDYCYVLSHCNVIVTFSRYSWFKDMEIRAKYKKRRFAITNHMLKPSHDKLRFVSKPYFLVNIFEMHDRVSTWYRAFILRHFFVKL